MSMCYRHAGALVVYNGDAGCPACQTEDERDELIAERDDLKQQLQTARTELEDLANDAR